MIDQEKTDRLRALWKSGRDKYSSFYVILNEVRKEIGDEALPNYCYDELLIGISRINAMRKVLTDDDAARVKAEMEASVRKDRARREAEAHARAREKLERKNELSRLEAENVQQVKAKAAQDKKAKQEADKARRQANYAATGKTPMELAYNYLKANPIATNKEVEKATDVPRASVKDAREALKLAGVFGQQTPKAEAASNLSDAVHYDQCVARGRILVNNQWGLGNLAIEVSARKRYGEKTLERFADDINIEYKTLLDYQGVAKQWSENSGRPENWSVASALRTHPERVSLVAKNPTMTVAEAREIMRNVVNLRGA